ncbi:MAG: chromosome segregation ATPase [Podoviridae sp. ctjc_2]|nr:MAG: chromosome segregation ATPase [Podoviridae sp. ctjc_2]
MNCGTCSCWFIKRSDNMKKPFQPNPLPPDFPPFCPPPAPPPPPMQPPVPSVVKGMDLYEAVNHLVDRVNLCISSYNSVMSEGYKTLHNMQAAAMANGAYYDHHDVWTEEGYSAEQGASYHIIHKRAVDRSGEPIRIQLHLAYGNTTNSLIKQSIMSASEFELADKILVAQAPGANGWYGKVMYQGAPLPSSDAPTLYTMGFTRSGVMRVYNNGVTEDQLYRDTIENSMGVPGVLIQNGQIMTDAWINQIPAYDQQTSRVCMGQNLETREIIMLVTGTENDTNKKGMTSAACAEILLQYGCDIAVELSEGVTCAAMDKGQFLFTPANNEIPEAYCFWYISRKCHYRNQFQDEVAKLIQLYGQQLWKEHLDYLKTEQLQKDLLAEVERATNAEKVLQDNIDNIESDANEKIQAERERAEAAERVLQQNINAEQQRAEQAEATLQQNIDNVQTEGNNNVAAERARAEAAEKTLQDNINAEQARAETAESQLDQAIKAETTRAETAEAHLQQNINAEQTRAEKAETLLQENINAEQERAEHAESDLHNYIDTEIEKEKDRALAAESSLDASIKNETSRATAAEAALSESITAQVEAEQQRAEAAENALSSSITNETARARAAESALSEQITSTAEAEKTRAEAAEAALNTKIEAETTRATQAEDTLRTNTNAEFSKLNSLYEQLSQQVATQDNTIVSMQTTISQIEEALNSLKSLIAGAQATLAEAISLLNETKSLLQGLKDGTEDIPYLKLTGGFLTGPLILHDDPKEPLEASTKRYVEAEADSALQDAKDYTDLTKDAIEAMLDAESQQTQTKLNAKVSKAGDNMTGPLVLPANATANLQAVPLQQVNALISAESSSTTTKLNAKVSKAGDTMTGPLTLSGNATANLQAVPLQQVNSLISAESSSTTTKLNAKVSKAGDTMTGPLTLSGNATANLQAVPLQQVNALIKPVNDNLSALTTRVDNISDELSDLPFLKLTGGTVTGKTTFNSQVYHGSTGIFSYIIKDSGYTDSPPIDLRSGYNGTIYSLYIQVFNRNSTPYLNLRWGETGSESIPNRVRISNVADGIQALDAATVNQVNQRVLKTGDVMSGSLHMGFRDSSSGSWSVIFDGSSTLRTLIKQQGPTPNLVLYKSTDGGSNYSKGGVVLSGLDEGAVDSDAVNVKQLKRYLPLAGGELSGDLTLGTNSLASHRLIFKGSQDSVLVQEEHSSSAPMLTLYRKLATDANFNQGGVMITGVAPAVTNNQAVNLEQMKAHAEWSQAYKTNTSTSTQTTFNIGTDTQKIGSALIVFGYSTSSQANLHSANIIGFVQYDKQPGAVADYSIWKHSNSYTITVTENTATSFKISVSASTSTAYYYSCCVMAPGTAWL